MNGSLSHNTQGVFRSYKPFWSVVDYRHAFATQNVVKSNTGTNVSYGNHVNEYRATSRNRDVLVPVSRKHPLSTNPAYIRELLKAVEYNGGFTNICL